MLFDVDYAVDDCKYKYVAECSFTFLHWKMIEMLRDDKNFSLQKIDSTFVRQLLYNILPGCNTVLHYVVTKQNLIRELYACSEGENAGFQIPFLSNIVGESPIHLCISKQELKNADLFF